MLMYQPISDDLVFKEREKEDEEAIEGETVVPGETNTEVALAGKKSIETVKGVDNYVIIKRLISFEQYDYLIFIHLVKFNIVYLDLYL